jgi:hypothetical protein
MLIRIVYYEEKTVRFLLFLFCEPKNLVLKKKPKKKPSPSWRGRQPEAG